VLQDAFAKVNVVVDPASQDRTNSLQSPAQSCLLLAGLLAHSFGCWSGERIAIEESNEFRVFALTCIPTGFWRMHSQSWSDQKQLRDIYRRNSECKSGQATNDITSLRILASAGRRANGHFIHGTHLSVKHKARLPLRLLVSDRKDIFISASL